MEKERRLVFHNDKMLFIDLDMTKERRYVESSYTVLLLAMYNPQLSSEAEKELILRN